MVKICKRCGETFETKKKDKKYCSYACYVYNNTKRFPNSQMVIARYKDRLEQTTKF